MTAASISAEHLRRIAITSGCHDCDALPKTADAGAIVDHASGRYQIMHNGLRVEADAYCGPWMTELIRRLRGHHEPQEERVFHELLARCRPSTTMLELGSGWAYYAMWYARQVPGAQLICVEPDPVQLALGQRNVRANGMSARWIRASVGRTAHDGTPFARESGPELVTPELSVDALLEREGVGEVEMVVADIQGAELAMLEGASASTNRIRFLVVATHHHTISRDPLTHQRCLAWINEHGGHVLAAFNVTEGFAGDGLIAASFRTEDATLPPIAVSRNHPTNSLFRELEYDLADTQRQLDRYRRWFGWRPWRWRVRR